MKTVILIIALSFSLLFANYKDIPVTRDPHSDGNYGDLERLRSNRYYESSEVREISRSYSESREEGSLLIVVQQNLYPQIESSINVYLADLTDEGYDVFLVTFAGSSAFDLKVQIVIYQQLEEIVGVVLIGNLPVGVFEMFEDFNANGIWDPDESWVNFPCELFLADLDGIWEDLDNNGFYDVHRGNVQPDLFIGRIRADNLNFLPSSEAELINSYFARNHLYRRGFINFPSTALAYIDDDWSYWGDEYVAALEQLYSEITLINEINATTADDYREIRLQENYEFIQVHVHSGPEAHHFYQDNGSTTNLVTNYQISAIQPNALFYNLFACSNSRFTIPNNMGAMYIYGNQSCFATIGSTKTGSMLFFEDFYGPLGQGECLGEALRLWWIEHVDVGEDWMWQRAWFYGNIIQGDPTLKLQFETDLVIHIPANYPTIQEGIIAAENGDIILVQPGTYVENINFMGKNITVGSLYYTTGDTTYISQTIIDGNQSGSVVTFNSGETNAARLTGFTITNGLFASATFGGGGILIINSSPVITRNVLKDNVAIVSGGGIYVYNGSTAEISNNIFVGNSSLVGGGISIFAANPFMYNNVIMNNEAGEGGGIHLSVSHSPIINNTVSENYSTVRGGGIYVSNQSIPLIINSISYGNNAFISGDEVFIAHDDCEPVFYFCDIQGGLDSFGFGPGVVFNGDYENNIDVDPLFTDPINNDFHLQDESPCLGAGIDEIEIGDIWYYAPEFDFEGNPRPNPTGSMPDMGAYENPLGEPQVEISNNQLPMTNLPVTNYPNPFNPSTTISFSLTTENTEHTEITIYNLKGQKVKTLDCGNSFSANARDSRSTNSVIWNGDDENGKPVSSGIYLAKLKSGKIEASCKMLLLK